MSGSSLFEIENHGLEHKPCSVNGKSSYGIAGTADAGAVFDEIEKNARKIESAIARKPRYYRSGTAYYDEIATEIAEYLGCTVVGFSVLGEKGATYSKEQVKQAFLNARPGDIIVCHMNHPEGETAEGVIAAIPALKKRGFRFVKLSGAALQ